MKDIVSKIQESYKVDSKNGDMVFSQKVKYTKSDWEKWKKETKEDVLVGNYENSPELELVYIPNHKAKTMEHIATYNTKTQVLFCDDINLFGNEV